MSYATKRFQLCSKCGDLKRREGFYKPTDKICRTCLRAMKTGIADPQDPLYVAALKHKIGKLSKKEEKKIAHQTAIKTRSAKRLKGVKQQAAEELDRELASRTLARRRLLHFVQRFHTKYQPGWVHHDICRRLEKFSKDVAEKRSPRLLILTPPRLGKSEIGSRKFPAWHLGQYPDHEFISASNSASLALTFSRHIRELLRSPSYQNVFPECRLDPESQGLEAWLTTRGGGYTAAGVGTGIVGKGAHILSIDDPIRDMVEADSPTTRDAIWDWYLAAGLTRLAPGGGVLGILTWWNDDDWAGRIQAAMASGEGEKFEVVKYPAINEGYDEYLAPDGAEILRIPVKRENASTSSTISTLPVGTPLLDPPPGSKLLRLHDTALHEERYALEYLLRLKKNYYAQGNQRIWSALYQQNPAPDEGVFFTKAMMQYYSTPPDRHLRYVYQAWDFAITQKTENDWNVCSTMLQDEHNAVYELDLVRFKTDNSFVIADAILDAFELHKPDMLGFEDGQIWKSVKSVFEKRCEERRLYPSYEILAPLSDKMARAGPLKGRMQLKKVWFPAEHPERTNADQEMLRFPAGKHDDIIDARAWCVRLMLTKHAPRMPEKKPPASWKEKLQNYMETGFAESHMSA